jgi:hybrid cluster-associated redox disulfide protein
MDTELKENLDMDLEDEEVSMDGEPVREVCGIRSNMTLGDIMTKKPEVIPILMEAGMHCVSCPAALMETLEEAAIVHGMNIDELMEYIEESLKRSENA